MFTRSHLLALALWLFLAGGARTLAAVEIIGHRGASYDAPENTLASMKLGWAQGADAVELDLWLSKDDKLIVFHDSDTKRFEKPPRKITSLTLEEARKLDVGSWKSAQFQGEPIPTLESILAAMPKDRRIVLEIKHGPEIVPEFTRVLRASGVPERQFIVISFNFASLAASKKDWPNVPHLFLHDYKKDAKTGALPELAAVIQRAKSAGFEGLNLSSAWPIDKAFVSQVKAAGLKMYVWTVDDPIMARRLMDAGIDGLTTNKPGWMWEQLK